MTIDEALTFDCAGEQLVGVVSTPRRDAKLGVLVLVGGPQYRVGSHRQFLLLARALADAGIAVMRFDYRGMGDSTGGIQGFEDVVPDVAAAIDAFKTACSSLDKVVLWGLCDAASSALLYWRETRDRRVAGMVLLNPWIRSDETLARTHIKHYYGQRLLERAFWAKLARGRIDIAGALRSFVQTLVASRRQTKSKETGAETRFQERMAGAMESFSGPILLILSGRDLTAKEFLDYTLSNPRWPRLFERANIERRELPEADHTFSSAAKRQSVEALTLDWLRRLFGAPLQ